MAITCKGICINFKANWKNHEGRYASGQKRCNICDIFMVYDENQCPCCGVMLRTKSRRKN